MKGESGQTVQDSLGAPISFLGQSPDPAPLHGHEGELARDEEGVDEDQERDEGQSGRGTNLSLPWGSQSGEDLNGRRICHSALLAWCQEDKCSSIANNAPCGTPRLATTVWSHV